MALDRKHKKEGQPVVDPTPSTITKHSNTNAGMMRVTTPSASILPPTPTSFTREHLWGVFVAPCVILSVYLTTLYPSVPGGDSGGRCKGNVDRVTESTKLVSKLFVHLAHCLWRSLFLYSTDLAIVFVLPAQI